MKEIGSNGFQRMKSRDKSSIPIRNNTANYILLCCVTFLLHRVNVNAQETSSHTDTWSIIQMSLIWMALTNESMTFLTNNIYLLIVRFRHLFFFLLFQ